VICYLLVQEVVGGKSAWFVDPGYDVMLNTSMIRLRFYSNDWYSNYLKYFISSNFFKRQMECQLVGMQPNFGSTHLSRVYIPIPPLEEQKAIVAKVDVLMKEIDALEQLSVKRIERKNKFVASAFHHISTTNLAGTMNGHWDLLKSNFHNTIDEVDNVKKLRETILQLAVQGKLTRQFREQNPDLISGSNSATTLLEKIKAEKAQLIQEGKIKKEKPLPPIADDEIPYELPEGWVWCRLTELVSVGTGATPTKGNLSYYNGGTIPWFTSSATNQFFATRSDAFITDKALQETNCKVFPTGSLIIALYGQGKTRGQISELMIDGATNQAIAAMVFYNSSMPAKAYLKYFFQKIYHEIRLLAEGGAQPNLNVGKIKNTLIPVPSMLEQKAIVEKVNQLMSLCDQLEQHITSSQHLAEDLMKSLVREVFDS
jgi:type I restriction enzyme S subunit